jgi:translation initiation factor eIF-2B subunit epsilon
MHSPNTKTQPQAAAGINEVFVFAVVHADQVAEHVRRVWQDQPGLSVRCVVSKASQGPGDALREMYLKNHITTDFLLVSGDVVSNMKLSQTLKAHKARRREDSGAIMTSIFKKATPAHRTRAREDDSVVVIDPDTQRLLHYENDPSSADPSLSSAHRSFADRTSVQFRYDLIDCHIDICAPIVLFLFTDNFDYQDLRQDFIRGVLNSEIQYKVCVSSVVCVS